MTSNSRVSRRLVLQAGAASTILGAPGLLLAQPKAVKIGLVHPVSGALAYSGSQSRFGAQFAIDEINAAGGIKSMGGAKLEAALGDSQSRPEVGVAEVERLHQEGVSAYVGCFSSAIALPATQAAAKYNTPFMIDVGVSDAIVSRGLKNVFRLAPGNGKCVDDAFAGLSDVNKAAGGPAKTAVIVHEDSEFGTSTAKLLAGKLSGIGLEVKEVLKHATPTRDFSNLVLRIKSLKPDLVIISNYQNEYVLLARTLYQQKAEVAGIFSVLGGGFNYRLVKEQPEVAQYMMDFNHWYNPKNAKAQAMRKAVEAKGNLFTFEVYCSYNSVKCYADALERAKTDERAAAIAALEASTWFPEVMPYGPTKFVNGQNTGGRAVLLQATKTDIGVVWPNEFAEAKPVFPRPKVS
ncbi:ABC transporter substrate-binding protein [Ramlibacter sp. G-1-2-2]|uniref:ABC transporter substrate-binding protein n=1 Tax=Ramlibacter agri TaxID=2728837 RepID=A0A848HJN0_9BURK|nr:ABC transporter substrate-binding protein [Ramlibacter agri]NML48733.1 ABC transporter substrate-binding protein [Ramlibacter agri]